MPSLKWCDFQKSQVTLVELLDNNELINSYL
jgi:hypothetical protein